MTFEELDEIFENDWNEAVKTFEEPPEDAEEDAFTGALKELVFNLQRRAWDRGYQLGHNDSAVPSGPVLTVSLDTEETQELLKALVNGAPLNIALVPFE